MLTKMVDGKRVILSEKEEAEVRAEWKRNEEERAKKQKEKEARIMVKNSVLHQLGLNRFQLELLLDKDL